MTEVFDKKEKAAARREKKILFWTWFAILVAYLALVITLVCVDLYLVEQYRNRDHTLWMGVVSSIATAAFAGYSLFFFSVKYRLTRKFVAMLRDMDRGLKDTVDATFMGYEDALSMKDGVYFYTMVLKTKPLRRDDIDERKLLIEHTVPKIELSEGTRLRLVSHANILVAYEILSLPETTRAAATEATEAETTETTQAATGAEQVAAKERDDV